MSASAHKRHPSCPFLTLVSFVRVFVCLYVCVFCFARPQVHHASGRAVGGTGLGLAISKSLCESMGGTVGCRSTPGVGSTFYFSVLVGVVKSSTSNSSTSTSSSTAGLDGCGCGTTEALTCPCSDSAGSAAVTAGPLVTTPCAAAGGAAAGAGASVRGQAAPKAPRPFFTQEWNLAVEGTKFSLTTEVLEQRRRHSKATRRSGCSTSCGDGGGGGGGGGDGGGTEEVRQDELCDGVLEATASASLLAGTAGRRRRNSDDDDDNDNDDDDRNADDDNHRSETATRRLTPESSSPGGGGRIASADSGTGGRPAHGNGNNGGSFSSAAVAAIVGDLLGAAGLAARKGGGGGGAAAAAEEEEWRERPERDHSDGASSVVPERPRVLVADDFRMNRVLVRKMLEALDVEVDVAEDGAKAVEACRGAKYSVILVDVIMPVMDGIEAVAAIRGGEGGDANRNTPIIALTASPTLQVPNNPREGERGENGFSDLLMKPMTRRTLFAKVAKWASEGEVAWMIDAWSQYTAAQEAAHKNN